MQPGMTSVMVSISSVTGMVASALLVIRTWLFGAVSGFAEQIRHSIPCKDFLPDACIVNSSLG